MQTSGFIIRGLLCFIVILFAAGSETTAEQEDVYSRLAPQSDEALEDFVNSLAYDYALLFEDHVTAREQFLDFAGRVLLSRHSELYSPIHPETFKQDALDRVADMRQNYPDISAGLLSFVIFDPLLFQPTDPEVEKSALLILPADTYDVLPLTLEQYATNKLENRDAQDEETSRTFASISRLKIADQNVLLITLPRLDLNTWSHSDDPTTDDLRNAIFKHDGAVILDLRGNEGGLLDNVADISGYFVSENTPLFRLESRSGPQIFTADHGYFAPEFREKSNVIVLIDSETNSGAIMIAKILHEQGVARIYGEAPASVKGSVETVFPIQQCSAYEITCLLKLPTSHLYTSTDQNLSDGITPDGPAIVFDLNSPTKFEKELAQRFFSTPQKVDRKTLRE